MMQILLYTASILFLLYFTGFGITSLFLPKHLRKDIFWFTPWTGIALIALYGVILSFAKVPMSVAAYVIMGVSGVAAVYALLMRRFDKIPLFETAFLAAGVSVCFILTTIPLFKEGYPTVLSLGNVDPISYTNVADFFVKHTVWEGKDIPAYSPYIWAIGDIVHYSYRWGSPLFLSFFNEMLRVRSYQTFSIIISLLFALSFPLVFIFAKQLVKKHHLIIGLLLFFTFSLNSTLTYMLYHVFFAQFIFTGLYIYILILFFHHQYPQGEKITSFSSELLFVRGSELLLALLLSSITTLYPEGLIFILFPFIIYSLLSYLLYRDIRTIIFFVKMIVLMLVINPVSLYTSVMQNMKIIFSTSRNTFIGWEQIRHATPIEMLGFYNLYYYKPLPLIIRLALAFGFMGIWFIGFIISRHKLWIMSLVSMFFLLLAHFVFNSPNFFLYHRNVTYSIFLFSTLFAAGMAVLFSFLNKRIMYIVVIILALVTIRSYHRSFGQFYYHHITVDRSLITLEQLAHDPSVPRPFYTSEVFIGEYNLWRRLWQEYFLSETHIISNQNYPTEEYEKRLATEVYILAEKNKLSNGEKKLSFKRKIWENEFYILGEATLSTDEAKIPQ